MPMLVVGVPVLVFNRIVFIGFMGGGIHRHRRNGVQNFLAFWRRRFSIMPVIVAGVPVLIRCGIILVRFGRIACRLAGRQSHRRIQRRLGICAGRACGRKRRRAIVPMLVIRIPILVSRRIVLVRFWGQGRAPPLGVIENAKHEHHAEAYQKYLVLKERFSCRRLFVP